MNWYGISGSWRKTNTLVEEDVRSAIKDVFKNGHGIVSGGALGVDYIATAEALNLGMDNSRIRIIIPTTLKIYANHFFSRAREGVILNEQADSLINQLEQVKSLGKDALIEMDYDVCNEETYYARNSEVIRVSTHLLAFQVNNSGGVQDAINKAFEEGKQVIVKRYQIP